MNAPAAAAGRKAITLHRLREMQGEGEPITMLTAYDASFARAARRPPASTACWSATRSAW